MHQTAPMRLEPARGLFYRPRWTGGDPGLRVPTIIIAPFAKRHYVDHTLYDTTPILKLIETRWNLRPLGTQDRAADDLTNAFDF